MKNILFPGETRQGDQQNNQSLPTLIHRATLVLHDPVFADGYETGCNACFEHLHDESPIAITDFTLQTLFVTAPIPADCASPLSWQLGYYLGYVKVSLFPEAGGNYGISHYEKRAANMHVVPQSEIYGADCPDC